MLVYRETFIPITSASSEWSSSRGQRLCVAPFEGAADNPGTKTPAGPHRTALHCAAGHSEVDLLTLSARRSFKFERTHRKNTRGVATAPNEMAIHLHHI